MYNYEELKHEIFTDEGQKVFLKVRDFIHNLLDLYWSNHIYC